MIVTVRLYATLRDLVPGGRKALEVDLPEGTTVGGLIARLGIPAGTVRKVFVGGIIPQQDIPELKALGVSEVFLPGASTRDVIRLIQSAVPA